MEMEPSRGVGLRARTTSKSIIGRHRSNVQGAPEIVLRKEFTVAAGRHAITVDLGVGDDACQ